VGVNLLVFTIVNALWIRPLPFPEPDRVVTITNAGWVRLDGPQLRIFDGGVAGQVDTTEYQAGLRPRVEVAGRMPEILGVTSAYFRVLRLPIRGRDFTGDDERAGAEPVAIISDRLWAGAFGRRPEIIGSVIPSQPLAMRVIGVAPPEFTGIRRGEQADVWIPANLLPRLVEPHWEHGSPALIAFGRLGPQQTVDMADARFWDLTDPRTRDFLRQLEIRMARRARVVSVQHVFGTPETRTFMIDEDKGALVVAGLAVLVLLGGCATIAALVLVHYERRRTELAVKMSLGAGRFRLICELSRDLALVALTGGACGLLVAWVGARTVPALSLPGGVDIGRLDLSIDWRVCVVAIGATLATLFVAAMLPITRATRPRLASELAGHASSATLASQRVRQALLAFQVCATIIVLVAAGLFVRAVVHGFGSAPGFDMDRTVFVSIQEPRRANSTEYRPDLIAVRNARRRDELRAIAGVAAVAEGQPTIGPSDRFVIKKLKALDKEHVVSVAQLRGSPDLLETLGVPILQGRALNAADTKAPYPAIVTESLARRLFPDGDAVGQPLRAPVSRYGPFIVVGIARDFPFGSLSDPGDGAVITAQPILHGTTSFFVVRTDEPAAVARTISRTINAQFVQVVAGRQIVARDIGRQRLGAWFFTGFGIAALLLGLGGAFGLVAYLAESQRREFGVRLALGANMRHLVARSVSAALLPVSVGVTAGLLLAALVSRLFTTLLTGISALDVVTYAAVAFLTLGCALIAALAGSWRLRRTTPSDALRAT
jgi:predicted permease